MILSPLLHTAFLGSLLFRAATGAGLPFGFGDPRSAIVIVMLLIGYGGSFALVVWLWETSRLTAIVGLAGVYLVGTIAAVVLFKRFLARQPPPFAATLNELKHDRACIRPEN